MASTTGNEPETILSESELQNHFKFFNNLPSLKLWFSMLRIPTYETPESTGLISAGNEDAKCEDCDNWRAQVWSDSLNVIKEQSVWGALNDWQPEDWNDTQS